MNKAVKWVLIIIGILFGLFFLFSFIGYIGFKGSSSLICKDMGCFVAKANQCQIAVYVEATELGKIMYSSKPGNSGNCILIKEVVELSQNEDPFLKKVLKGKKMECVYSPGQFNGQWTTSLIEGLEDCQGELKDAIGTLLLLV